MYNRVVYECFVLTVGIMCHVTYVSYKGCVLFVFPLLVKTYHAPAGWRPTEYRVDEQRAVPADHSPC